MADSFTPNLNMTKPEIDASPETWGQKLNADLDLLDAHAGSMIAFVNSQPANINNAIVAALNALLPRGVIVAWAGQANQVPSGWLICNGANGTPNLQDRFILGTAGVRNVWEIGGAFSTYVATDAQGWHSHSGVTAVHALTDNEMPSHQHGGSTDTQGWHQHNYTAPLLQGGYYIGGNASLQISSNQTWQTDGQGAHGHNIATDWRGASWGHNHGIVNDGNHAHNVNVPTVPPYFALCYIMRA